MGVKFQHNLQMSFTVQEEYMHEVTVGALV